MAVSTKQQSKSLLLEKVPEEEILSPTPRIWRYGGKEYEILPMPDSSYMLVADQLQAIADAFRNVAGAFSAGLTGMDFLPLLPAVAKALIPCQSKLIATSTGMKLADVEKIPMIDKMKALHLIIQAENLPALVETFMALAGEFGNLAPANQDPAVAGEGEAAAAVTKSDLLAD